MFTQKNLWCVLFIVLLSTQVFGGTVIQTAVNPTNGHTYSLIAGSSSGAGITWTDAESTAKSLGGHLVTINDSSEQSWISSTFSNSYYSWIGLNDTAQEGRFVWASGQPVTYTNWAPGEPNNTDGNENYVHMYNWSGTFSQWNDLANLDNNHGYTMQGIAEVAPLPVTHVLSIGIADDPSQLRGDIGAQKVEQALRRFATDTKVVNLNTSMSNGSSIITNEVSALKGRVHPGDSVVIYVNGHACFETLGNEQPVLANVGDPLNGVRVLTTGNEYLKLSRGDHANDMSDDAFAALFTDPVWNSVNKLFVMDTCYAQGFWGGKTITGSPDDLSQLSRSAILAASAESEVSYAYPDFTDPNKPRCGILGQALVRTLNDSDSLDLNGLVNNVQSQISDSHYVGDAYIQGMFEDTWTIPISLDGQNAINLYSEATSDFEMSLQVPEPCSIFLVFSGLCMAVALCANKRLMIHS